MDHCLLQRNFCFDHHCYHKRCGLCCWQVDFWPWFQQGTLRRIFCHFGLQVTGFYNYIFSNHISKAHKVIFRGIFLLFLSFNPYTGKTGEPQPSPQTPPSLTLIFFIRYSPAFDVGFSLSFSVHKQNVSVVFFFFSSVTISLSTKPSLWID